MEQKIIVRVFLPQRWRNTGGINFNKLYFFTLKQLPSPIFVLFFPSVFSKAGDYGLKQLCRLTLTSQKFYCHNNKP